MSRSSFDASRTAQLRAVGTTFLARRPLIVAPTMGCFYALLVASGAPRRQLTVLAVGFTVMLALFVYEALRGRRRAISERWLFVSLTATTVGITFGCALTGALRSPILPLLFAPVVVTFSAFGRGWRSLVAFSELVLMLGALALLPRGFPFAEVPYPYDAAMSVCATAAALLLLHAGVTSLSDAYLQTGRELHRTREQVLAESLTYRRSAELLGARLAHEIKNPLLAIKALTQLFARGAAASADDKSAERLEVVQQEIERVEQILADYVAFTRPLGELALQDVELGALCRDAVALCSPHAELRGIVVEVDAPAAIEIRADRGRLADALLNLLRNALDASEDGATVRVLLRASDGADDGGAEIVIEDHGGGMDAETISRAGTPYYSTRDGGSGLGLALARAALARHGGELSLSSEPGVGTRARVTLPRRPASS
ncbi:MAG: HAMP domain-containing histidine kinase [Myxococcales bacterium]|nr:HAMP domain-containing histidine kinase [Myxococcales bacterium]